MPFRAHVQSELQSVSFRIHLCRFSIFLDTVTCVWVFKAENKREMKFVGYDVISTAYVLSVYTHHSRADVFYKTVYFIVFSHIQENRQLICGDLTEILFHYFYIYYIFILVYVYVLLNRLRNRTIEINIKHYTCVDLWGGKKTKI